MTDSVNSAAQMAVGHNFTENEAEWQSEKKCTPPYLVIHFGPTREYTATPRHMKKSQENIVTYNAFAREKKSLHSGTESTLHSLVSSTLCSIHNNPYHCEIHKVDSCTFGITDDNMILSDVSISANMLGYQSHEISPTTSKQLLDNAMCIHKETDSSCLNFIYMAEQETDNIKKFLYFWLAIEIYTNSTFKRVDKKLTENDINVVRLSTHS